MAESLLPEICIFIKKETQAQMFSCKLWEIFKNTFFTEHIQVTDAVFKKKMIVLEDYYPKQS